MRRILWRISFGLCLIYVTSLVTYVFFRGVPADSPWWLDLLNVTTPYLFIPGILLLPLALLAVSRPLKLLSILPVILFVSLYGGSFMPKPQSTPPAGDTLTVMTHNVEAVNPDPERIAQAILESDPDIVALQELRPEMAETLSVRLSNEYRYQALLPLTNYSGVGVFSRFPIEKAESFTAGHLAQHLIIDVYGRKVNLFNFHLRPPDIQLMGRSTLLPNMIRSFDTQSQKKQVATMMEKVGAAAGPILVIGDFNITDQSRQYGQVTQDLIDTFRETGWGLGHTFPANTRFVPFPLLRIDYMFHSREFVGLDARVGNGTNSDHLPLTARFSLNKNNNQ